MSLIALMQQLWSRVDCFFLQRKYFEVIINFTHSWTICAFKWLLWLSWGAHRSEVIRSTLVGHLSTENVFLIGILGKKSSYPLRWKWWIMCRANSMNAPLIVLQEVTSQTQWDLLLQPSYRHFNNLIIWFACTNPNLQTNQTFSHA